ncbi:MAG: hypothetical protein WCH31_02195 [Actinomycetes bacterium]
MRLRAVSVVVAAASLVAGCGSSKPASNGEAAKTPTQIIADALAAAGRATSVHLTGSGTSSARPLHLDLHLVMGKGGTGSVTLEGLTFDILRIGGKAYFQGGPGFWSHFGGKDAAALLKDRWLVAPATSREFASFTPMTDARSLLPDILNDHGTLKVIGTTTLNGVAAIEIRDTTRGGTLYIAATGEPYPIEIVQPPDGKLDFGGWNDTVDLTAPHDTVSLSALDKLGG